MMAVNIRDLIDINYCEVVLMFQKIFNLLLKTFYKNLDLTPSVFNLPDLDRVKLFLECCDVTAMKLETLVLISACFYLSFLSGLYMISASLGMTI
jgi:hypothetical protein